MRLLAVFFKKRLGNVNCGRVLHTIISFDTIKHKVFFKEVVLFLILFWAIKKSKDKKFDNPHDVFAKLGFRPDKGSAFQKNNPAGLHQSIILYFKLIVQCKFFKKRFKF